MRGRGGKKTIGLLAIILLFSLPGSKPTAIKAQEKLVPTVNASSFLDSVTDFVGVDPATAGPRIYASSFVLIDSQSSTILAAKNPDESVAIASTTKMTTALVARQLYKLDQVLTVPKQVALIPGSDIQLRTNEKMTVSDLLKGLLIQSGNDAAYTLAYNYSNNDSYQPFVDKMNEFVRDHTIQNSHYGDPAGLDDETGRSTARNLAAVARLVLQDPVLSAIVKTPATTIYSTDQAIAHELKNSNRLIVGDDPLYLPQVSGIKTGFTPAAGHCLVASYQTHGRTLIGVVLNTTDSTITASAFEMRKLFLWADQNITVSSY